MGIRMMPEEFPESRRDNPIRNAEGRVIDALLAVKLDGFAIYELRSEGSPGQVDLALWVTNMGRFAVQVKGGRYRLDENGQWSLASYDGGWERVNNSPLQETVDASIAMRQVIKDATGYKNYIAGILLFPDMEQDPGIERVAIDHEGVYVIWGVDNLRSDLEHIAGQAHFYHPPKAKYSENEWQKVNQWQYRGVGADAKSRGGAGPLVEIPPADKEDGEPHIVAGSVTIHIAHVEKLEIRQSQPGPTADGKLPDSGA